MTVSQSVVGIFNFVKASNPELYKSWITISARIGALLPDSLLMASVQKVGELDLLLRAMEDEYDSKTGEVNPDDFSAHYLIWLSELWIGSLYENSSPTQGR